MKDLHYIVSKAGNQARECEQTDETLFCQPVQKHVMRGFPMYVRIECTVIVGTISCKRDAKHTRPCSRNPGFRYDAFSDVLPQNDSSQRRGVCAKPHGGTCISRDCDCDGDHCYGKTSNRLYQMFRGMRFECQPPAHKYSQTDDAPGQTTPSGRQHENCGDERDICDIHGSHHQVGFTRQKRQREKKGVKELFCKIGGLTNRSRCPLTPANFFDDFSSKKWGQEGIPPEPLKH